MRSIRLRNSGRNARATACSTLPAANPDAGENPIPLAIRAPRFEVMMITAWRKSAGSPRGSLSRPSSKTCRNRSQTLGSAFSNSSSSTTENGWRRIRATSEASSGSPEPSIRRAEPGFWYSLQSIRIIRSPEPNRCSASALAISVLPVPVGPTNSSTACGRVGSVSPAFSSATRSTMHSTASGWPITREPKKTRSASTSSRTRSSSSSGGSPERSLIVASTSSIVSPSSPGRRRRIVSSNDSSEPGSAASPRKWRPSASASRSTSREVAGASRAASASVRGSSSGATRTTSNASRTCGRARTSRS